MILKVVVVDLYMFVFVHHHHACTSICIWTSYMSSSSLHYTCWYCAWIIIANYGDLLLHASFVVVFSLFYSYIELISFFGLEGTCCVTTPRIATPNGFIFPFKYFWGQSTYSPNFLFLFWSFPDVKYVFHFFHSPWRSHQSSFPII